MHLWVTFGYLFAPEELATKGALDLVRMALFTAFRAPIFRNLVFQFPISPITFKKWLLTEVFTPVVNSNPQLL